jgi:hypothetical protein
MDITYSGWVLYLSLNSEILGSATGFDSDVYRLLDFAA